MKPTVAIVSPGRMGSAVGRVLTHHGIKVRADLEGRSAQTVQRAEAAGIEHCTASDIAQADIVLSILPPAQAIANAENFVAHFQENAHKPIFVDLNATNPSTAGKIERIITESGAYFVDGCIIGTRPRQGYDGPWFFFSGSRANDVAILARYGLKSECLAGPNGGASALKMCFAGIMKGLQALGCASTLAAERSGAAPALMTLLNDTQPELAGWFSKQIPAMYPKTYRWIEEMEEIGAFLEPQEGSDIFKGAADLFTYLASEDESATKSVSILQSYFHAAPEADMQEAL